MSDEQRQAAPAAQATQAETIVGEPPKWGDPISAERQAELRGYLDRWAAETDHAKRMGPFDFSEHFEEGERLKLTGADVAWLAEQSECDEDEEVPNLHLEGAYLYAAYLERANLARARLEYAFLVGAHLERANLHGAHLEHAKLGAAHLEGANLHVAYLERADLDGAHLEGAYLSGARLGRAFLHGAYLQGAQLQSAHLEGADLQGAGLERAKLRLAGLEQADLRNAWMDKATALEDAALDHAKLDQLSFDGTNLAVVKWESVTTLGDEVEARAARNGEGCRKTRQARLDDYAAAVRAHLQLSAVLRSQGMSEQADRFAYRAQVLQRARNRLQRRFGQWLFSWVLFSWLAMATGQGARSFGM